MGEAKVYHSKIDFWLLLVLLAAMAVSGFAAWQSVFSGASGAWWAGGAIALVGIGLPLWVLLGTNYRFEADDLIVRGGPFRWRITISEIAAVVPTSSPVSSPALSLDRLKIEFGAGRTLLVSPRDKDEFRADIERRQRGL